MSYEKGKKRRGTVVSAPEPMENYEAEEDLRCYARAQEVMKDPERMKKMQAAAKRRLEDNKRGKEELDTLIDIGQGKKDED